MAVSVFSALVFFPLVASIAVWSGETERSKAGWCIKTSVRLGIEILVGMGILYTILSTAYIPTICINVMLGMLLCLQSLPM